MSIEPAGEAKRLVVKVRHYAEDGRQLVSVPLFGVSGEGKHMVLDADVWRSGRETGWPLVFTAVKEPKSRKLYVVTCRAPFSKRGVPRSLARIIMGAVSGEVVQFTNGDTLDLRLENLEKMSRIEFWRRRFGLALEVEETVKTEAVEDGEGVPW